MIFLPLLSAPLTAADILNEWLFFMVIGAVLGSLVGLRWVSIEKARMGGVVLISMVFLWAWSSAAGNVGSACPHYSGYLWPWFGICLNAWIACFLVGKSKLAVTLVVVAVLQGIFLGSYLELWIFDELFESLGSDSSRIIHY